MTSLKKQILIHLKSQFPKWCHKGEILKLAVNVWGYETETAGRRCRELENEGLIEKSYSDGCVIYRTLIKEEKPIIEIKPVQTQLLSFNRINK